MRPILRFRHLVLAIVLHVPAGPSLATEMPPPTDLGAMLAHAAIVENMVAACGQVRTDLGGPLGNAWKAWRNRNSRIADALRTIEQEPTKPYRHAALQLYQALQRSLQDQTDTLQQLGHTEYADHCDDLLQDLISGRLDYGVDREPELLKRRG